MEQNTTQRNGYGWKETLKGLAIVYAIVGAMYGCAQDTTGHVSSDIYTGRAQPTRLERSVVELFKPLFEKR